MLEQEANIKFCFKIQPTYKYSDTILYYLSVQNEHFDLQSCTNMNCRK
jgi:hypothetical protein